MTSVPVLTGDAATPEDGASRDPGTDAGTDDGAVEADPGPVVTGEGPGDPNRGHLRVWLEFLEARIHVAISELRARRASHDPRFRGVFLSDDEVDDLLRGADGSSPIAWLDGDHHGVLARAAALLDATEQSMDAAEAAGTPSRLRTLQRRFGLDRLDVGLLVAALAPDVDTRFERLVAYLHDDVTRRRPSFGLALQLLGADALDPAVRVRLSPNGPLVRYGLVDVEDAERAYPSRTLRVPDRVVSFLLGDDAVDPSVEPYLVAAVPVALADTATAVGALAAGARLFYLRDAPAGNGGSFLASAFATAGLGVLEIDATLLPYGQALAPLVRGLVREAGLLGAGLVVTRADELVARDRAAFRALAEAPAVVGFVAAKGWHPDWARTVPFVLDPTPATLTQRTQLWQSTLEGTGATAADVDVSQFARLRMRPSHVVSAVQTAQLFATAAGRATAAEDLVAATRVLNSGALDDMARRVIPTATWSDLVLAPLVERQVRELLVRARHRELVLDTWRLGGGTNRRRGTVALFSGPPGTGKTLAAEVVAHELGIELFVVNIATVVDKYIGETEKNLERIFHAAEAVNGILFFDEADALFGKRSEVKDARDRYANVETAYLLQRLEIFDGVTVLATNLRSNFDEAFARRLDVTAEFQLPAAPERAAIWDISLPLELPLADDVDIDFLAERFTLSGGNIRNICVSAAFRAAEEGVPVCMRHLIGATAAEHRKLGRLVTEHDFAPYYACTADA